MYINLYIDTTFKKVKSLQLNSFQNDWVTHIITMHGYIVDTPFTKIPSAPTKLQFTNEGYKDSKLVSKDDKVRPSGYIDLVVGSDISTTNPYTIFINAIKGLLDKHTTNELSKYTISIYHNHPNRPAVLPNHDPILDGDFIRDSFMAKVADTLGAKLRDDVIPATISTDLINMGCLESVAQGRTLRGFSNNPQYWKRHDRPIYLRGDTQLALTGDTGREFRSMQYDGDDMVSTEKFNSTNTAHYVKETDGLYFNVLSIFNKYFDKPKHQKVLIDVDTKGLYSKQFSALYNKFGVSMLHVVVGDEDVQSTIILGDFFNNQTKSMVTIKPMIRIPSPEMVMTRVFLTELFRLGLKYIMDGEQVLTTDEYNHIDHIDVAPVEWDGSFESKLVVEGKRFKMPFVPEVGFHTNTVSNSYAKLKNRKQYSMSIEAYGIVYHAIVVGNEDMLYAGACGELPVLIGSRSTKKVKLEISEVREETQEWHNKIYDKMMKHGMYGKPS